MVFVENPNIKNVNKIRIKERWINLNKSITSFFKINKFIYFLKESSISVAKRVRSQEGYEAARNQIINTILTGLLIGFAIMCLRTGNSFLLGIFVAIMLVIIENYMIWFKENFKEKKK